MVITQNANTNLTVNNSNGQNVTVINGNSSGDTFSYTGQGGIIDLSNSAIALAAGSSATLSGNGNTLAGGANASIELAGASINDIITMATTGTVVVDTGAACTVVNALTITAANSTNVTVEGTSATTVTAGTASTVNVGSNTNNDVVSVGANGTVSVADGDHGEVVNETGGTVTLGNGAAATVVGNDSINGGTGSTLTLSGIDTVNSTNDKLYLGGSTNITTSGTGATIYTGLNDVITGNGDIFNIGGNLLAGQVATTGYTTINGTANIVNAGIGTMFGLSGIDTVNGTSDKLFLTGSANLTTNGTGMMVYTGLNDVITGNGDIFNIGGNLLAGQVATTGYTTINGNANTVNAGTGTMFGLSGSDTLNGTNDKLFLTDSASLTAIGAGMTVYTDLNNVINGTGLTVDTGGNLQAGEAATSGYTTIVGNANTINAGTGTMFGLSGSDTLNGTNDKLFLTDSASLTAIGAGMTVYTDLNNVINGTGLTVDTGGNLQAGEAATSGYTTIVGNANTINAGTGTMFGLSGSDTVNGTSDKLFLTDSANLTAIGAGMTVYTDLNNVINGTGLTVNTGGNLQAGEVATSGYTTIVGNANTINAGTGTMFGLSGTITSADSLRDFVLYAVGHGRFAAGAIRASPWLLGLLAGVCGRGEAKARFLAATVGGMEQARLEELARDFAVRRLPAMVRPEMLARIAEHKRLSHRLVLVSASPSLYLKHWAENAGFDTVLATELAFRDERFSGTLASSNCWGPQKVQRLQHWFDHRPPQALYAYGDSRGDREMLALADHAWLRGAAEMPRLDDWPAKTIAGRSAGVS
ncbi:HAD phosphoserine phosphatase-like hydrolase, IB family protein [Collimonas pratensis]|uniref:HAD phosphoserine phosphatase-like hydrolase, IB family protein n=2 Tax=Collimonas pratensis TaxID=279113 RepID=A0A127Q2K1_9BURK|nr:HAD phosphoserine phosphatase-like hydrolase, IB family protein [Collimonas pratensis]